MNWKERCDMTEEKVKECYIEKKMTLIDTAKELHVNLTVLHNFIVTRNLVKDTQIINKFESGGVGKCI